MGIQRVKYSLHDRVKRNASPLLTQVALRIEWLYYVEKYTFTFIRYPIFLSETTVSVISLSYV